MKNSANFLRGVAKIQAVVGMLCGFFLGTREVENIIEFIIVISLTILANLIIYALFLALADRTEAICQIRDAMRTENPYQSPKKLANSAITAQKLPQSKPKVVNQSTTCPHCGNAPTSSPCEMCGKTF